MSSVQCPGAACRDWSAADISPSAGQWSSVEHIGQCPARTGHHWSDAATSLIGGALTTSLMTPTLPRIGNGGMLLPAHEEESAVNICLTYNYI